MKNTDYSKHYSDSAFINFIRNYSSKFPPIIDTVTLWFALNDPDTPAWVRALIVLCLGYLIFPLDACPDFIPVAGLLDDAAFVASTIISVGGYVEEEHRQQAREWLGLSKQQ